jgi:hypothetical protein
MLNAILLSLFVTAPTIQFNLDKLKAVPKEEIVATTVYTIPTNEKVLSASVIAISQFGHYMTFTNVSRTDSVDANGNKVSTFVAKYTFTSPLGTWKVTPRFRNERGYWTNASSSTITFTLVKTLETQPPPVVVIPAPTGTTGVTAPTSTPPVTPIPPSESEWLNTKENRIIKSNGMIWMGRGANLMDTRGCGACASVTSHSRVDEVKRRLDELVKWGANFIRLTLESQASSGYTNYRPVSQDPQFLADIKEICDYVKTKPGLYIEVSLWIDSSFSTSPVAGWPTAATIEEWKILTNALKDNPRVMFGLVNEPQQNYSGTYDAQVWNAMNNAVQAIRDVETATGSPKHLIAVQGTGGWARFLKYYTTHPITAGGGVNVIYEVHVYDPSSEFKSMFEDPSLILPVIIGEFGPANGYMTLAETQLLMDKAEALKVPYLAWAFHMRCPPNLLVDNSNYGCGINMVLTPTEWGTQLKNQLAKPLQ